MVTMVQMNHNTKTRTFGRACALSEDSDQFVRSESLLGAFLMQRFLVWTTKTDQIARIRKLIWVFVGAHIRR